MAKRFIDGKAVVGKISLSKTEMYHRINAGTFPRPIALGPQKVVFLESEIDAWMQVQIEGGDKGDDWRRARARKAVAARRDRKAST